MTVPALQVAAQAEIGLNHPDLRSPQQIALRQLDRLIKTDHACDCSPRKSFAPHVLTYDIGVCRDSSFSPSAEWTNSSSAATTR